jgi:GT2 family glycosyltransferase
VSSGFQPSWVTEVDLAADLGDLVAPARVGQPYEHARVLARHGREPIGFLDLQLAGGRSSAAALRAAVEDQLPVGLQPRLPAAAPRVEPRPTSVVLCTRDRRDSLEVALRSLLRSDHPDFEVLVIESAPKSDAAAEVVESLCDHRVRVIRESVPGLSRARNRGVAAAAGELIAFTDDDVIVDADWLWGLTRGFTRASHVGCVTGLIPAAELETEGQFYFDSKVAWSGSCQPRLYDLGEHRADGSLYPYTAGAFGAGANFALLRDVAAELGPFDEALGAGSPAMGGEDLDYFLRIVRHGLAIAYEPAALVWHIHRREFADLRRQMIGYGSGLTAYACKQLTSRQTARDALRRMPAGLAVMATVPTRGSVGHGARAARSSRTLRAAEARGLVAGPLRYLRGRRALEGAS